MKRETSRVMKAVFLTLGLLATALGFIGVFLPVLPTTPFLIVAAACFARSSTRLEAWLLAQPHFGPLLVNWRERGAIPRYAKGMAVGGSSIGFVIFVLTAHPGPWLMLAVGAIIAAGMIYVVTRPDR
ncbi:MAG TPA: YbaN family protein [Paenirhodobacter sp.]